MKTNNIVTVLIAGFMGIVLIGCGNSPDGDGQKPTDGAYGVMSDSYGPAGDGNNRRMSNSDPSIDRSARRSRNEDPEKDLSKPTMKNN